MNAALLTSSLRVTFVIFPLIGRSSSLPCVAARVTSVAGGSSLKIIRFLSDIGFARLSFSNCCCGVATVEVVAVVVVVCESCFKISGTSSA